MNRAHWGLAAVLIATSVAAAMFFGMWRPRPSEAIRITETAVTVSVCWVSEALVVAGTPVVCTDQHGDVVKPARFGELAGGSETAKTRQRRQGLPADTVKYGLIPPVPFGVIETDNPIGVLSRPDSGGNKPH